MRKIILTTLLIFSSSIAAHDLPNTFEAGQPIVASEVNENFNGLQNQINVMESQINTNSRSESSRAFIGLSGDKTDGNAGGAYGLNQMCDQTYEGSKACLTSDYIKEANPALILEEAWLRAEVFDLKLETGTGYLNTIYYPLADNLRDRLIDGYSKDCFSWSSSQASNVHHRALVLSPTTRVTTSYCNSVRPVACCK